MDADTAEAVQNAYDKGDDNSLYGIGITLLRAFYLNGEGSGVDLGDVKRIFEFAAEFDHVGAKQMLESSADNVKFEPDN